MPTDHYPGLIRPRRGPKHQRNHQPLPHSREALPPEALSRLAQQVGRILQRIRTEGAGRADRVRGRH
jgi:hypothetical protein